MPDTKKVTQKETTHTPGPWEYLRTDGVIITHRPDYDVSHEIGWSDADYQLCAAAPDLLAAAKRALDWLASYPGDGARNAYDQMRAAIAKAEGRSM